MLNAGLVLRVPVDLPESDTPKKITYKKERSYASVLEKDQYQRKPKEVSPRGGHAL